MSDSIVVSFDFPGVQEGERAVKMLDSLQSTLKAGAGAGKSLEELRKILVGMKGQGSVLTELRDAVKGLNTVGETFKTGFAQSFSNLAVVLKDEFGKLRTEVTHLKDSMLAGGVSVGQSFSKGLESGLESGEKIIKASAGKNLALNMKYATEVNTALQQVQDTGNSRMFASISKRAETIRRILESGDKLALAQAVKTYGTDFVAVMQAGLAKETEVLARHGETTKALRRAQHEAMVVEGRRAASELAAVSAQAQSKAAFARPTGDYSTLSSGKMTSVKNDALFINMPSKADYLFSKEKEAAEAAEVAKLLAYVVASNSKAGEMVGRAKVKAFHVAASAASAAEAARSLAMTYPQEYEMALLALQYKAESMTAAVTAANAKVGETVGRAKANALFNSASKAAAEIAAKKQAAEATYEYEMVLLALQYKAESMTAAVTAANAKVGDTVGRAKAKALFNQASKAAAEEALRMQSSVDTYEMDMIKLAMVYKAESILATLVAANEKVGATVGRAKAKALFKAASAAAAEEALRMQSSIDNYEMDMIKLAMVYKAESVVAAVAAKNAKVGETIGRAQARALFQGRSKGFAEEARVQAAAKASYADDMALLKSQYAIPATGVQTANAQAMEALRQPRSVSVKGATEANANVSALNAVNPKVADNMAGALSRMTLSGNNAHSMVRGLAAGFNLLWLTWGNTLPLLAGAVISMSFAKALKSGAEFSEKLFVIGELAGASAQDIRKLSDASIKLGETSQYGPLEVAEALKTLSLAGLSAAKALEALKPTLDFAAAGGVATEAAAATLVAVSTAYRFSAENFQVVGDIIARTAADTQASVSDMSEAFKSSSVLAQQYGVTLDETATAIGMLAQIGIKGSAAGTSWRNMMTEFNKGSGKAAEGIREMGVELKNLDGTSKPIMEVMESLSKGLIVKTATVQDKVLQDITNERGAKAVAAFQSQLLEQLHKTNPLLQDQANYYFKIGKIAEGNLLLTDAATAAYEKMNKKVRESSEGTANFSFLANLEGQFTPLKLLAGLSASLGVSLVKAFEQSEGAVTTFAMSLREVLNSKGFQSSIQAIVTSVTSVLTLFKDGAVLVAETVSWAYDHMLMSIALAIGGYAAYLASAMVATAAAAGTVGLYTGAVTLATLAVNALNASFAVAGIGLGLTLGGFVLITAAVIATSAVIGSLIYNHYKAAESAEESAERQLKAQAKVAAAAVGGVEAIMNSQRTQLAERIAADSTAMEIYKSNAEIQKAVNAELSLSFEAKKKGDTKASKEHSTLADELLATMVGKEEAAVKAQGEAMKIRISQWADYRITLAEVMYDADLTDKAVSAIGKFFNMDELKQASAVALGIKKAAIYSERNSRLGVLDEEIAKLGKLARVKAAQAKEDAKVSGTKLMGVDQTGGYSGRDKSKGLENAKPIKLVENNELMLIKAQAAARLSVEEQALKNEQLVLKSQFDARLINRAEFEAQDLDHVARGVRARQAILDYELAAGREDYVNKAREAKLALTTAQEGNVGKKGSVEKDAQNMLVYSAAINKAGNELRALNVSVLAKGENFASAAAAEKTARENAALAISAAIGLENEAVTLQISNLGKFSYVLDSLGVVRAKVLDVQYAQQLANAEDLLVQMSLHNASVTEIADIEAKIASIKKLKAANSEVVTAQKGLDIDTSLLEAAKRLGLDIPEDPFANWGSKLDGVFGKVGKDMSSLLDGTKDLLASNREYAKTMVLVAEGRKKGGQSAVIAGDIEDRLVKKTTANQIDSFAKIAGGTKNLFDKKTAAYKILSGVETGMHLLRMYQMGAELYKELFLTTAKVSGNGVVAASGTASDAIQLPGAIALANVRAVGAVANQGGGDPYTAFPRIAAMIAVMAGIGLAVGAGGGGEPTVSHDTFSDAKKTKANTGTLVGDSLTQSQSIANSLSNLESMAKPELSFISQMVVLLKSIDNGLSGTTNAILASGFDLSGANFVETSSQKGNSIFGKSTSSTSLSDLGLRFQKQTVAEASKFLDVQKYQVSKTERTSSGFLGFGKKSSTDYEAGFEALDVKVSASMSKVIESLSKAVSVAATKLGATSEALASLGNVDTGLGKVSLLGKSGDEVQKLLSSVFSALGDKLAETALPGLDAFQRVGEGYLQTLIKVGAGMEEAALYTAKLGIATASLSSVQNKQGDVGAEIVRQSIVNKETKLATLKWNDISYLSPVLSSIGKIVEEFSGTAGDLTGVYQTLVDTRLALVAMGFSAEVVSAELLRGAGGLDALASGLSDFQTGFMTVAEQTKVKQARMDAEFAKIGLTVPTTSESFKSLVQGLQAGGAASSELLGRVLVLSGGMTDLFSGLEASLKSLKATSADLQISLLRAQGNPSAADAAQRLIDIKGYGAAEIAAYDYNAALTKQIEIATSLKTLTEESSNLQIGLLRAQGDTAAAEAAQRLISIKLYGAAEIAVYDFNAALKKQTETLTERTALESQLLQMQNDSVALRNLERKSIKEANQDLFDKISAVKFAQAAVTQAFDALKRSVAAEKERITIIKDVAAETVNSIKSVFDLLKAQVSELYGIVDSTKSANAVQGNAFIDTALSTVLSSGYMPNAAELSAAIAAARAGLDPVEFATQFEADQATLVMAGKLSQLQAASGYQLSTAELTLKAANDQLANLDKSLVFYQVQIDTMNGINTSVISVGAAVANLATAIAAQTAAMAAASALQSSVRAAAQAAPVQAAPAYASQPYSLEDTGAMRDVKVAYQNEINYSVAKTPEAKAALALYASTHGGANTAYYDAALAGVGGSFSALGWDGSMAGTETLRAKYGFAVGINRVPFDMTARIHEGEAVVPASMNPFNPNAKTNGMGNGERLEKLVEGLTAEVQRLQSLMAEGNRNTERTAIATNGNPDRPVLVEIA